MDASGSRTQARNGDGFVDFHSHLMPAVDDGAQTLAHSLAALRAFQSQGASACITTPHFDASLTKSPERFAARMAAFDAAWARLQELVRHEPGLPVLHRGVELMLDDPDPDLSDPRLRLAAGPFVLVEFPAMQMPPNAEWAVNNIRRQGFTPIIAHPERYRNHDARLTTLTRCRAAGAHLQINAGSLLGQHGERAREVAKALLTLGWAEYLASDHHARGEPATARAVESLRARGAEQQALHLTVRNPARILTGEAPLPVETLDVQEARSWWAKLLGRIKPPG